MKTITHVVIKKFHKCVRCGREEANPEEITVPLERPVTFDEKSDRVAVEYLTVNS